MPNLPHAQISEVDARACVRSYLTLGSIFLLLALFGLFVAIKAPTPDWNFVYIPTAIGLGVVLWLRTIRLTIVEKVETQLIGTSKGQYRALMVYPYPEKMQKPMRVNIGAFSREDLG